jgi:hypothetical protein
MESGKGLLPETGSLPVMTTNPRTQRGFAPAGHRRKEPTAQLSGLREADSDGLIINQIRRFGIVRLPIRLICFCISNILNLTICKLQFRMALLKSSSATAEFANLLSHPFNKTVDFRY